MFNRFRLAALGALLAAAAFPAAAQEFGPAMLPADTTFVIYSHGIARAETMYPSNPMIQSWNSADFAQLRQQAVDYWIRHADWKANGRPLKFSSAEVEQMTSFIKSPMMLGFSGGLDMGKLAQPSASATGQIMNAGGMFVIVDLTGKAPQFDFLYKFIEASLPKEIARTRSDFSGVSIEKFTGPNATSFTSRVGNYFVWSNQQKVMEELVSRASSHSASAKNLAADTTFQQCLAKPDADSVSELYFRFPDLSKTSIPASDQYNATAAMNALHLDSLRAICGSIAVTKEGEHSRMFILGDTKAGGIFDVAGPNRAHFDSLALAPATAFSYSGYSFDLTAIYNLVRTAALAALPPQQAMAVSMVEGMAGSQLGMPLTTALSLISGEFATIQLNPGATDPTPLFAITISDSDKVLALIHKLAGSFLVEDSHEAGLTLFTRPTPATPAAKDSSEPAAPTYYFGVTPHFLLAGTDKAALRKAAHSDSAGATLADSPEMRTLRAALPNDLLGFSVTDYTHYDWAGEIAKSITDMEKADKAKLSPEDIQFFDNLKKFGTTSYGKMTFRRSVGGWWKAPDGIHYEGFTQ